MRLGSENEKKMESWTCDEFSNKYSTYKSMLCGFFIFQIIRIKGYSFHVKDNKLLFFSANFEPTENENFAFFPVTNAAKIYFCC